MRESRRYLGLELAGAKNQKTALAVLEYYPKEQKTFLLDIFDRIVAAEEQSADEALVELIQDFRPATSSTAVVTRMGVNVPMELPPCIGCIRRSCPMPGHCSIHAVKWMREFSRKNYRQLGRKSVREFTPYTQRPVELYIRDQVLAQLPPANRFEIDEALGGNKAPLTARMMFLLRHLKSVDCHEVWPKLSVSLLALELGLSRRLVASYRNLEEGAHSREEILEHLAHEYGVFIYERDIQKLAHSLPAFDAFICAFTILLMDEGRCAKMPAGFPHSAWVQFPQLTKTGKT
ncbi:MAG: hypothetical protein A2X94_05010 [Bdellovibrionales bacterium GWB1_55_8]|nr:MAG: hypothetical protein A2X94_05010 [Bdellovibrionales bacterium GWB1_55_8]